LSAFLTPMPFMAISYIWIFEIRLFTMAG